MAWISYPLEYEAALKRPEHLAVGGRTEAMTDAFLDVLCLCCEPVDLYFLWRPRARDPADDMVLETALNGRADRLVTFNTLPRGTRLVGVMIKPVFVAAGHPGDAHG